MTIADDPLLAALQEYRNLQKAGSAPAVNEFAERHLELGAELRDLLLTAAALDGSAASEDAPARLGEYRLLREVGRGGMGVVYEAVQESLGRRVAVKILSRRDGTLVERFQREARIAARLHHTNIVPVFAVGADAGLPFYVMQFIDGRGLNQWISLRQRGSTLDLAGNATAEVAADAAPKPLDARGVAAISLQAAEALAYAHGQGVLHRDLKPSNFLLDTAGTLWIADFGLAKAADDGDLTGSGAMLGTLRYLAPERLAGKCDEKSDIYSLGATLYELLTLLPAFDAADHAALVEQVTHGTPPPPRSINLEIPRDLETIVVTALSREPGHRYASAGALAEDLRRFLAGAPIAARPPGPVERLGKWARRNPAWASLAAVAAAALVTIAIYSIQLRNALDESADYSAQLRTALDDSNANLEAARVQNKRADGNLAVLRQAIDKYTDEIEKEPRLAAVDLSDVKKKLLASAVGFYETVAAQQSDDPEAGLGRLDALVRLGKLRQYIGDRADARADFDRAVALAEELQNRHAGDLRIRSKLGEALHARAHLTIAQGKIDETAADFERAIRLQREVLAADAGHSASRGLLIQHLAALTELRLKHRPKEDAAPLIAEALALSERHVAEEPKNPLRLRSRALALSLAADIGEKQNRYDDAEKSHRAAVALFDEVIRLDPATVDYVHQRVMVERSFGFFLTRRNRFAEADECLARATTAALELHRKHSSLFVYRQNALVLCTTLGRSLWMQKKGRESLSWFDKAVNLLSPIPESGPDRLPTRQQHSDIYYCRAMVHEQLKQHTDAAGDWERAASLGNDAGQCRIQRFWCAASKARAGRHGDSLKDLDSLLQTDANAHEFVQAAKVHAVIAASGNEEREAHASRAVGHLKQALARNYKNAAKWKTDDDFTCLRDRADFRALLPSPGEKAVW